jgi:uncharacterized protein YndB with AHSA1/START domain
MPSPKKSPAVHVELMIRVPAPDVFTAFVEPKELKKFWLAKASAPLVEGKTVRWDFKVRGAKDTLTVLALEPYRRIRVQWSGGSITEWTFTPLSRSQTIVHVAESGFTGTADAIIDVATETAQGYAYVLSDLKVLLERRLASRIVQDKGFLIERAMAAAKGKR